MNKQMTINVKVQGLEHLRETVALLKELKELGAGNCDALTEYLSGASETMKTIVEVDEEKPWYPHSKWQGHPGGPWIEHDGKSIPDGEIFHILTRAARDSRNFYPYRSKVSNWKSNFMWDGDTCDNVVAYRVLED